MLASWLVAWARIRLQQASRRIELGGKVNAAQASQHGPTLELPQSASASDRQTSVSRVQARLATLARFTDAVSRVCGSQQLVGDAYVPGRYEVLMNVGEYFERLGAKLPQPAFFGKVPLRIVIQDAGKRVHLPVLFSPWGFSFYRGS